jgi:RNA polymerase sigma-70 factor (ECF subfamily)
VNEHRSVDRQWIQSALEQYEGPLTIYAARLLGDVDRARDVVQDTFLKLWQADRAAVDGYLAKWLYTVCRNRALDVRRKEHRMTTLSEGRLDSAAAPGKRQDESAPGVIALVADLPHRQQEAVRLKFQGGLSYREIAEVMDTTANNVGVLLHTAINTIRQKLAAPGTAPGKGAAALTDNPAESTTR